MNCHEIETLLDDYVDRELTPEERRTVERHVASCPACGETLREIEALVRAARELPRAIAPERELFDAIRERAERPVPSPRPGRDASPARRIRWMALAASLLLVAIAASTGLWLHDDAAPAPPAVRPVASSPDTVMAAGGEVAEPIDEAVQEYVEAADLLLGAIEEKKGRLAPETVAVLEENVAIIDQAIADVRSALEVDPSSRGHALLFTAMHEQKVEFLRRVARLSS